jgi:hypothetical protein
LQIGLSYGVATGTVLGTAFRFTAARRHPLPRRIRLSQWHQALRRDALRRGLVPGVIVGLGIGLLAWGQSSHPPNGLAAGAAAGLATALVFIFSGPGVDDASSAVPASSWHNDLAFGLVLGLLVGLVLGIVSGLVFASFWTYPLGLPAGLRDGLGAGLGTGLAAGIVFMLFSTRTSQASLAFVQLAVRWHTPLRLMRFLEDARQRNVLRIIGPVYQFCHARLQDRLAGQAYQPTGQPEPLAVPSRSVP